MSERKENTDIDSRMEKTIELTKLFGQSTKNFKSPTNVSKRRKTSIIDIFLRALKDSKDSFIDEEMKSKEPLLRVNFAGHRIVNPLSTLYLRWLLLIFILALYSGISTPIEVAFFQPRLDFIFWINRVIDCFFWLDIAMNFRVPYVNPTNRIMVTDIKKIKKNYLRYWFIVDFLAVIPADLPGVFVEDGQDFERSNENDSEWYTIRFLRLLRMIKLLRLLRAAKSLEQFEKKIYTYYQSINIVQGILKLLYIIHLMACGLVMISSFSDHSYNWEVEYGLTEYDPTDDQLVESDSIKRYITAAYWATMTTTTIGYGDVAMVANNEKLYAIFCMIIGASLYAFMTARFAQLILYADKTKITKMETIAQLNGLLNNMNIPPVLQYRVRDYFHHLHRDMKNNHNDVNHLLIQLSPALRGRLATQLNGKWVEKVDFFRGAHIKFITELSLVLRRILFSPKEIIVNPGDFADKMYIIKKGLVLYKEQIMTRNQFFGEEMILTIKCKRGYWAVALNYVDTSVLLRHELMAILRDFPEQSKIVKKSALKITFRKKIKEWIKLNRAHEEQLKKQELIDKFNNDGKTPSKLDRARSYSGDTKLLSLREFIDKESKHHKSTHSRRRYSPSERNLTSRKYSYTFRDQTRVKHHSTDGSPITTSLTPTESMDSKTRKVMFQDTDIKTATYSKLQKKKTPWPDQLAEIVANVQDENELTSENNGNNQDSHTIIDENDETNDSNEPKVDMDNLDIQERRALLSPRKSWTTLRGAYTGILGKGQTRGKYRKASSLRSLSLSPRDVRKKKKKPEFEDVLEEVEGVEDDDDDEEEEKSTEEDIQDPFSNMPEDEKWKSMFSMFLRIEESIDMLREDLAINVEEMEQKIQNMEKKGHDMRSLGSSYHLGQKFPFS